MFPTDVKPAPGASVTKPVPLFTIVNSNVVVAFSPSIAVSVAAAVGIVSVIGAVWLVTMMRLVKS